MTEASPHRVEGWLDVTDLGISMDRSLSLADSSDQSRTSSCTPSASSWTRFYCVLHIGGHRLAHLVNDKGLSSIMSCVTASEQYSKVPDHCHKYQETFVLTLDSTSDLSYRGGRGAGGGGGSPGSGGGSDRVGGREVSPPTPAQQWKQASLHRFSSETGMMTKENTPPRNTDAIGRTDERTSLIGRRADEPCSASGRRGSTPTVTPRLATPEDTSPPSRFMSFLTRKSTQMRSTMKRTKSATKLNNNDKKEALSDNANEQQQQQGVVAANDKEHHGSSLKRTMSLSRLSRRFHNRFRQGQGQAGGVSTDSGLRPDGCLRASHSHESLLLAPPTPPPIDLSASGIDVQALDSSVTGGRQFCFEVASPRAGTKRYSCNSEEQRLQWIQYIREAVRPFQEEMRRVEYQLKLSVLEAKNVPTKHKYYCEVCLDGTLFARTSSKLNADMLFWGEQFNLFNLQSVEKVAVNLYREVESKKKKRDVDFLIGSVSIPMSEISTSQPCDRWYTACPISGAGKGGGKGSSKDCRNDRPLVRVKAWYQIINILPLSIYRPLIDYVCADYSRLVSIVEPLLSVRAKDELASALVRLLHREGGGAYCMGGANRGGVGVGGGSRGGASMEGGGMGGAKEFLVSVIMDEVNKAGTQRTLFRANSVATKSMEAYMKLVGQKYLEDTLGEFIRGVLDSPDNLEVDSELVSNKDELARRQTKLIEFCRRVWSNILHSHAALPTELREVFTALHNRCRQEIYDIERTTSPTPRLKPDEELQQSTVAHDGVAYQLISSCLFLRFLCPSILSPSLFGLTHVLPQEKAARNLTLIAKTIQGLANFTKFGVKEQYMVFMNRFVEEETDRMREFIDNISTFNGKRNGSRTPSPPPPVLPFTGFIDLSKECALLHAVLAENLLPASNNTTASSQSSGLQGPATDSVPNDLRTILSNLSSTLLQPATPLNRISPRLLLHSNSPSTYAPRSPTSPHNTSAPHLISEGMVIDSSLKRARGTVNQSMSEDRAEDMTPRYVSNTSIQLLCAPPVDKVLPIPPVEIVDGDFGDVPIGEKRGLVKDGLGRRLSSPTLVGGGERGLGDKGLTNQYPVMANSFGAGSDAPRMRSTMREIMQEWSQGAGKYQSLTSRKDLDIRPPLTPTTLTCFPAQPSYPAPILSSSHPNPSLSSSYPASAFRALPDSNLSAAATERMWGRILYAAETAVDSTSPDDDDVKELVPGGVWRDWELREGQGIPARTGSFDSTIMSGHLPRVDREGDRILRHSPSSPLSFSNPLFTIDGQRTLPLNGPGSRERLGGGEVAGVGRGVGLAVGVVEGIGGVVDGRGVGVTRGPSGSGGVKDSRAYSNDWRKRSNGGMILVNENFVDNFANKATVPSRPPPHQQLPPRTAAGHRSPPVLHSPSLSLPLNNPPLSDVDLRLHGSGAEVHTAGGARGYRPVPNSSFANTTSAVEAGLHASRSNECLNVSRGQPDGPVVRMPSRDSSSLTNRSKRSSDIVSPLYDSPLSRSMEFAPLQEPRRQGSMDVVYNGRHRTTPAVAVLRSGHSAMSLDTPPDSPSYPGGTGEQTNINTGYRGNSATQNSAMRMGTRRSEQQRPSRENGTRERAEAELNTALRELAQAQATLRDAQRKLEQEELRKSQQYVELQQLRQQLQQQQQQRQRDDEMAKLRLRLSAAEQDYKREHQTVVEQQQRIKYLEQVNARLLAAVEEKRTSSLRLLSPAHTAAPLPPSTAIVPSSSDFKRCTLH